MEMNSKGIRTIPGSSKATTYMIVARRGTIALAIKPEAIVPSIAVNGPENHTYFTIRLRSQDAAEAFKDLEISDFDKAMMKKIGFASAWSEVVWEKVSQVHASTTVGTHLPGQAHGDSLEKSQLFLDNLENGALTEKFIEYIRGMIEPQYFIADDESIKEFLSATYLNISSKIREMMTKSQNITAELSEPGSFKMAAKVIKKSFDNLPDDPTPTNVFQFKKGEDKDEV